MAKLTSRFKNKERVPSRIRVRIYFVKAICIFGKQVAWLIGFAWVGKCGQFDLVRVGVRLACVPNFFFDPISGAGVVRMTGSISTREHQAIRFAQV